MTSSAGRNHAMVYATVPNRRVAARIGRSVVTQRLAACANLLDARSLFRWHGRVESAEEIVMIMKTRRALVGPLIEAVRAEHPYEVPCIVGYPMIAGLDAYLEWIDASTGPVKRRSRARRSRRPRASKRRRPTSRT